MGRSVTIETDGLGNFGWELGIFAGLSCVVSAMILQKINGDFSRLDSFFALKNWEFIEKSNNVSTYSKVFKGMVIFMTTWPLLTLLTWGGSVIVALADKKESALPGVSILLIGLCLILWVLGIMYVKFNNFKFTKFSLFCLLVGSLFFFAFQLVALLLENQLSFFGVSAVFLTANAMIMVFIVSMLYSIDGTTILEIIDNRDIVERGASMSKDDEEDLTRLIQEERENDNYKPTDEEIFQLFTLVNEDNKGNEIFDVEKKLQLVKSTALGGGLQSIYKETSPKKKVLLILSFYFVAIGLLVAYTIISYSRTRESQKWLGFVTTLAVVTTDIITIALIKLKLANGPIQITCLLIVFRALLFIFGGDYWFLGYCILYSLLGIFLNYHIVNRRYPFFEQTKIQKVTIKQILKKIYTYPEFVQGVAFLIFAILTAVLQIADFKHVPTRGFKVYGTRYQFYVFGIAAIFINLISFFYLMSVRIYYRKMKSIKDLKVYYLFCKSFGPYYIYLLLTYILIVVLGIIWYTLVEEFFFMFTCIFVPLIYECILIFYYNWQLNDYKIIADITAYNEKMKRYKEMRQKQQKKRKAYKIMMEQKNTDNDKSIDAILKDLDNNGEDISENKQTLKEDIQVHLGGVSGDIMAVKGNLATYRDWKKDGLSFFEALKTGKLLKTDYNTIAAIAVCFLLMIIYSVCVAVTSENWPLLGVTINVSVLTILCVFMPLKQYFATLAKPNLQQVLLGIFGLLVNFGWGAFYYFNKYEEDKKSGNDPQYYLTYFLFLLPWVITATAFYKKWTDNKYKMGKFEIVLLIISAIIAIGMGAQFMYAKSIAAGAGIIAFYFFIYYGWFLFYMYKKNNESLSKRLITISLGLIIAICAISLILALVLDEFNDFLGFSISYLVFTILLFIFSYSQLQQDFMNQHKEPLFFSPWVYPIFKFNADKGRIEKRTKPFGLFMLSCILFLVWAIAFSIWVSPVSIGTSLCNISVCFMFMVIIIASTWSQINLGKVKDDINQDVVKSSWLLAKEQFLLNKNATSNNQVQTYLSIRKEKRNFKEQIDDMKKSYGKDKGTNYFLDLKDLYTDFYSLEQQESLAFQDEIRLLIEFQVIIVLKSAVFKRKEKKSFVKFINSWQEEIQSLGIIFQIQPKNNFLDVTYDGYMKQFEMLSEEQQQAIMDLKKKYDAKQSDTQEQDGKRDVEDEKKRIERQKALEERLKQSQEDIDLEQPIDQIPDCKEKYLKILKKFRETKEKYTDSSFARDASNLSDRSKDNCSKWERPAEGSQLIKDGYSPMDIRQGMLGNCYYLSALSVIGEKNFRNSLLLDDEMFKGYEKEREECGAYICRFFYAGDERYVIVDDYIPMMDMQGKSRYLYAKSEQEGEIWPQILEKAYAKFYGSYGNIEGGKVAYAVMELAGGQPEEIELKQFQDNCDQFWNDIIEYQKLGYILGAGSPAHAMGDSAISEEGIVQGHAYSVLRVADLDGNKLIYLRNPHGNKSAEWTGDWGDKSYLWNARMKQLAECAFADDGCFWMSIEDFVYEYRALYVCRTFPESIWKTIPKITSGWIGKRAAGLPSKQNPDALMQENPHFGIKVYQKSSVFISLTILEKDPENPKNAKYPIYFMCQRNDGQRIKGRSNDKMVGQSGMPINLTTVSAELQLKASSYPYTFSLMCATMIKGGESPFIVQFYTSDKKAEILGDEYIN